MEDAQARGCVRDAGGAQAIPSVRQVALQELKAKGELGKLSSVLLAGCEWEVGAARICRRRGCGYCLAYARSVFNLTATYSYSFPVS